MKNKKGDDWMPLWIDKWIFGSTRIELTPDERSVWVDFIALSGKDQGYIRANETTPYQHKQLVGILNIDEELLTRSLAKFIHFGKVKMTEHGTIYLINHQEFELSDRHKRRMMSENEDTASENRTPSPLLSSDSYSNKGVVKGDLDPNDQLSLHLAKIHNQYCPAQSIELSRKHFMSALTTGLKITEQDIMNRKGMMCWNVVKELQNETIQTSAGRRKGGFRPENSGTEDAGKYDHLTRTYDS